MSLTLQISVFFIPHLVPNLDYLNLNIDLKPIMIETFFLSQIDFSFFLWRCFWACSENPQANLHLIANQSTTLIHWNDKLKFFFFRRKIPRKSFSQSLKSQISSSSKRQLIQLYCTIKFSRLSLLLVKCYFDSIELKVSFLIICVVQDRQAHLRCEERKLASN